MQYITPPPLPYSNYLDVPAFIQKQYGRTIKYEKKDILAIIGWAELERMDAIAYYYSKLDSASRSRARYIETKMDVSDLLARCDFFHDLALGIDTITWNSLDRKTQRLIAKAYEVYKNLPRK